MYSLSHPTLFPYQSHPFFSLFACHYQRHLMSNVRDNLFIIINGTLCARSTTESYEQYFIMSVVILLVYRCLTHIKWYHLFNVYSWIIRSEWKKLFNKQIVVCSFFSLFCSLCLIGNSSDLNWLKFLHTRTHIHMP